MLIRYMYTFFVGLFLAIFVGLGIAVFYEAPAAPEPPWWYSSPVEQKTLSAADLTSERTFVAQQNAYEDKLASYNRNVSLIVLSCAVVILAVALGFSRQLGVIADGLLLGGIFTLLYGVGRGMAADSNRYRFLIAAIGLAVTIALGYVKFSRHKPSALPPAGTTR